MLDAESRGQYYIETQQQRQPVLAPLKERKIERNQKEHQPYDPDSRHDVEILVVWHERMHVGRVPFGKFRSYHRAQAPGSGTEPKVLGYDVGPYLQRHEAAGVGVFASLSASVFLKIIVDVG